MMPYGFYSITSCNDDQENAMVANWVMQGSFEPRLVVVSLQKTSYTHSILVEGASFAVNIFRQADADAIMPFTKGRNKNPNKMENGEFERGPLTGCPILKNVSAYIECRVARIIDIGGDHDILLGKVIGGDVRKETEPAEVLSLPALGWNYAG